MWSVATLAQLWRPREMLLAIGLVGQVIVLAAATKRTESISEARKTIQAFCFARARPPRELLRSTCGRFACSRDLEFLHFSMQPFGAPADLAGLGPLPRADADAHGLCGGGVVSRAWAVLFSVSSVGKSINSSQFSVLHDCVSGRISLVMEISDGNSIGGQPWAPKGKG